MAKRLTSRLSAGAALVTGLGMMGIATAVPAQADVGTTLNYTCSVTDLGIDFEDPWSVNLTVGVDEQYDQGAEIAAPEITAEVTPGEDAQQRLRDLSIKTLEGTADTTYSFGGTERTAQLTVPETAVSDDPTDFVTTSATGTGSAETAPNEDTTVGITAGDFTAALTTDTGFVLNLGCTAPAENAIGTITIGESAPEPEVDDWFNEPGSLPLVDNVFTVSGNATRDGVLSIEVLAGAQDADGNAVPGHVLTSYTMDATEGANEQDFDLVEGADYVRVISQDCIDADGNDGTVAGGCNVVYQAPWAADTGNGDDQGGDTGNGDDQGGDTGNGDDQGGDTGNGDDQGGDTGNGDDQGGDTGNGDDQDAGSPEVPAVVQTDGLTPAMTSQEDNSAALALGGLLLAGAGAGSVLVMRRRGQQH
ncbi:DUF6801 domain-containing protein [Janibacter cremeus]|uniref:DUF6801 domain-containing protein n=1 Tax=Janibacter cremeus TaxID=1285192 RepID=A0A852VP48_9MICO|nr:DUF6801 domain-containing protein [Janibacter cremeus]NYF98807.1 hypothetical protein [Janibacter cremeus]